MGSIGNCCCDVSCVIGEDNFNRADANPPTGDWAVVGGEWEIDGNELNCITEGVLLTTIRPPSPRRSGNGYNSYIVVDLVVRGGVSEWGIITAYRGPGDYSWIKLTLTGGNLYPTFYSSPTTIDMDITTHPGGELWSPFPGDNFKMGMCAAHVEWTATNVGLQGDILWHSCTSSGVMTLHAPPNGIVGFLKGRFDNWEYYQHWESRIDCPRCNCFCLNPTDSEDYSCIPDTLTLTITADDDTLTCCPDGQVLTLHNSIDPDSSGPIPTFPLAAHRKRWYSDKFTCSGVSYWFILVCAEDGITLSLNNYGNEDPTEPASGFQLYMNPLSPPDLLECNPILMEWYGALSTGVTTCDLFDPPRTGIRPYHCDGCWETGTEPTPTWSVTITE